MICGSCSPLHVEKHHVRVMSADQIDGLDAVLSFRENFDAARGVEQILQLFACQFFVIDNEGGDGHACPLSIEGWVRCIHRKRELHGANVQVIRGLSLLVLASLY
jgi:hypothetical protein